MRVDDYGAFGSDQPPILPVIAKKFGERLAEKKEDFAEQKKKK